MDSAQGWQDEEGYASVFEVDDYLYFYGETLTDEVTERQVAALTQLLGLDRPMRILDLGCGHGRHANRLAALGHQVTGYDRSAGFLDLARRDATARGVRVDYRQGDMRQLDFDQVFDCALMLFTVFGYFDDDENLLVLHKVARALKPGGRLLFDILNRDVLLVGFRPDFVTEKQGNLMIDRNRFDMLSGRLYNQRIVIRNGERRDKPFFIRLYSATEVRDLLLQAGLALEQVYGGWEGQPLSTESRRMIIIARK